MVEAQLALIAKVHDLLHINRRQLLHVPIHRLDIQPIKHHLERRTQRQTPPTPPTYVIDPPQLRIDLSQIPKLRLSQIQRRTSHALCPEEKAGVNDRLDQA
jgi:hypothetical protein